MEGKLLARLSVAEYRAVKTDLYKILRSEGLKARAAARYPDAVTAAKAYVCRCAAGFAAREQ